MPAMISWSPSGLSAATGQSWALDGNNDIDINPEYVDDLQVYVDQVSQKGVPVTGQVLGETLLGRGEAVVDLAEQLHADLLILNTEEGGHTPGREETRRWPIITPRWRC